MEKMTKIFKNRKGQTTVEVVIFIGVVVMIVLTVWGILKPTLTKFLPNEILPTFNVCCPKPECRS